MNYLKMKTHTINFLFFIALVFIVSCNNETKNVNVPIAAPLKSGMDTIFHTDGKTIHMIGLLKNGKREGTWKAYYENNTLWSECGYKVGLANGVSHVYYENGTMQINGMYEQGKPYGIWEYYGKDAKKLYEINYLIDSNGVTTKF